MIASMIRGALRQRLVVLVIALSLMVAGMFAVKKLSVDAFPDVTNVQVLIATQSTGRSPEEMERFITVPLEISMTGLPGLTEMRSLNKSGLSIITLVFTDTTNVYFARQLVTERLIEVTPRMPVGIVPVLGPVSTGLGEVYQYTLERPDDGQRTPDAAQHGGRRRERGRRIPRYAAGPRDRGLGPQSWPPCEPDESPLHADGCCDGRRGRRVDGRAGVNG